MEQLLRDLLDDGYDIAWDQREYRVTHNGALVKSGGTDYDWGPGNDPLAASIKSDVHKQTAIWTAERHQRKRHDRAGDQSVGLYAIDADDVRVSVPYDAKVRQLRTPISLARRLREWVGELLKAA